MAVTLTEAAARHVNRYLAKRGKGVGVRLGVKTTGCSGLAYKIEYVDDVAQEDMVFEGHGVKILVEPKSFAYLDGTELDFVREGLNEGFKFNNPRERDRCGCGESFSSVNLQTNDFDLFGLSPVFAQDRAGLEIRWKALQREAHPDNFSTHGASAQRLSMQWSVRINEAYQRLKDPLKRAAYLCELNGCPIKAEDNTTMPAVFLMQQMEWRESLDDATEVCELEQLNNQVRLERQRSLELCSQLIDFQHDFLEAAQRVRALMFIERFANDVEKKLDQIDAASLGQ